MVLRPEGGVAGVKPALPMPPRGPRQRPRSLPTESIIISRRGAVCGGGSQLPRQAWSPRGRPLLEAVVGQAEESRSVEPHCEQVAIGLGLTGQTDLLGREPGATAGEDDPAAVGSEVGMI